MTDFMNRLTQMLSTPWVPWIILGVIAVGVLLGQVQKTGPSKPLRFSETSWLNALGWFSVLFSPILILLFLSVLFMLGQVGWKIVTGDTIREGSDNLRWYVLSFVGLLTALGGIIGTPLALLRVWTTERQTKTAEQGHITDRINKAVEGLGATKQVRRQRRNKKSELLYEDNAENKPDFKKPIIEDVTEPNIEVRVGAIFALERIAQDSLRDHVQIMEILCAYVRENAPVKNMKPLDFGEEPPKIREDIQTSLRAIGRRSKSQKATEVKNEFRLDLRSVDISGADLSGLDFSAAKFYNSNLQACIFQDACLIGTNFSGSLLNFSDFRRANAKGAIFDRVVVSVRGGFHTLSFNHAETFGISVIGAQLSGITHVPPEKLKDWFGSKDTEFGLGSTQTNWTNAVDKVDEYQMSVLTKDAATAAERLDKLRNNNWEHLKEWSAYSKDDRANNALARKFAEKRNIIGWPYWF